MTIETTEYRNLKFSEPLDNSSDDDLAQYQKYARAMVIYNDADGKEVPNFDRYVDGGFVVISIFVNPESGGPEITLRRNYKPKRVLKFRVNEPIDTGEQMPIQPEVVGSGGTV